MATPSIFPELTDCKKCTRCGETKHLDAFVRLKGLPTTMCRECNVIKAKAWRKRNPQRMRDTQAAYYQKNAERIRQKARDKYHSDITTARVRLRASTYNLTEEEVRWIYDNHPGECDLCGRKTGSKTQRLYMDHCHETGVIRGLLCRPCNSGLGALGDNIEGIERALAYLKRGPFLVPTRSRNRSRNAPLPEPEMVEPPRPVYGRLRKYRQLAESC